jgi:hypothetical protein
MRHKATLQGREIEARKLQVTMFTAVRRGSTRCRASVLLSATACYACLGHTPHPKRLRHGFGVSAGIPIDLTELLGPYLIVGAPGLLRGGGLDKTFFQPLDPCGARDRIASRCDRGSGRLTPPFC